VCDVDDEPGAGAGTAEHEDPERQPGPHAEPERGLALTPAPAGLPDSEEFARRAEETLDRVVQDVFGDKPPVEIEGSCSAAIRRRCCSAGLATPTFSSSARAARAVSPGC